MSGMNARRARTCGVRTTYPDVDIDLPGFHNDGVNDLLSYGARLTAVPVTVIEP